MPPQVRFSLLAVCVALMAAPSAHGDDWPQWGGPRRDGVWRETGLLARFPTGGPKVRWRVPVGEGYAGPAVADGKVYVTDRVLDKGSSNPGDPFAKTAVPGQERVLCIDDGTGEVLWRHAYPCTYRISYAAGPRTTPLVAGGKVFTLGAMGDLLCLDAGTGSVVWSKNLPKEYDVQPPLWGFSGSPLLDGDLLICLVGGQGSVAVAFHKDTGKEVWKALSASEPGYCSPIIYDIQGKRQLIVWHPNSVNGLDPATGKVHWSQKFGDQKFVKAGMTIVTPVLDRDKLFLSAFYDGSVMLKFQGGQPEVMWKARGRSEKPDDTQGLHCVMSTPIIKDGHIYGVCSYGELRCLKEDTGERLWQTYEATTREPLRWGHAFLVPQGDRCVLFNERGELILAELSPKGYKEIDRAKILEPTNTMAGPAGRRVVWSHPAFANRNVYARNDREILSVSMAE